MRVSVRTRDRTKNWLYLGRVGIRVKGQSEGLGSGLGFRVGVRLSTGETINKEEVGQ